MLQLWFMFETLVTVLDVFFNLCLHSFPPVYSLDLLVGFISTKMSSSGWKIYAKAAMT